MTRSAPPVRDAPPPLAEYSNVVSVAGARAVVFVSGQVALDGPGELCADASIEGQARQAFANVERCLAAAGLGFRDVAKFTTYITDAADIAGFYRVRREVLGPHFPDGDFPGNSLLVVARLVKPELLIEIEAVACAS